MSQLYLQDQDISELSDLRLWGMVRQYKKIVDESVRGWESATNKKQQDYHEGIRKDAQDIVSAGQVEQHRRKWL